MPYRNTYLHRLYISAVLVLTALVFQSMAIPDDECGKSGMDDFTVRTDSVDIESGWDLEEFDITLPRFINLPANVITLNGNNWNNIRLSLAKIKQKPFTILHIGDSHLQADIATGYVRQQLQFDYGDAGRGLIVPFKIGHTNQPSDYYFSSSNHWHTDKIIDRHIQYPVGFTGLTLTTADSHVSIKLGSKVTDSYSPFSEVILYYEGDIQNLTCVDDTGNNILSSVEYQKGCALIKLTTAVGSVTINLDNCGLLQLYGASLLGKRSGVYYNVVGNNGATYYSYNKLPGFVEGIKLLNPDLVIISLGTNEAFGNVDPTSLKMQIDKLVSGIRNNLHDVQLLLVTPMESERRKSNILLVRNTILNYANDNNIAVYDWYRASGGEGVSKEWINVGLYGRDHIHHTVKGYRLQGFLLYQAITDAIRAQNNTIF